MSAAAPAPAESRLAPLAATFLVSAAVLFLEVAWTRLLSFAIWYHFAYATIAVALLAFGASGALLAMRPRVLGALPAEAAGRAAALAGAGAVGGLVVAIVTPLDPFRLGDEPRQAVFLALHGLAVLVPFGLAGLALAVLLAARPERGAPLWAANLAGAGAGAFAAVPALATIGAPRALLAGALALAVAGVLIAPRTAVALAVLPLVALAQPFAPLLEPAPAASKSLARVLAGSGTELAFSRWHPVSRIDVVRWRDPEASRLRGVWSLWGGSERTTAVPPPQHTIAQDADAFTLMYRVRDPARDLAFLDTHALRLPYLLHDGPRVLVIGVGGGTDVLAALRYGARRVSAVDLNPVTASLLTAHFADWLGGVFRDRPEVTVEVAEGRHFARRTDERFDVVQVNGVDTLAALSSGAYVLAESYLYTVEALGDLYARLADGGVLSIMIMDPVAPDSPPRHMLRLVGVVREALRRAGVADPDARLAVIGAPERAEVTRWYTSVRPGHRPITTVDVLVKRGAFTRAETDRLATLARDLGFVAWHLPGRGARGALAKLDRMPARFLARFPLDLGPSTDDRPFFFNFYRWRDLWTERTLDADRATATGQLVLLAMLAQAVVLSALVLGVPLATGARGALRSPGAIRAVAYFFAIGLGFIAIELALVQKLVLFLGAPTRSLSVTLAGLLVAGGAGSLLTTRWTGPPARALRRLLAALALVTIADVLVVPGLLSRLLGLPDAARTLIALAVVTPLGLVLGGFFPLGLRALGDRRLVAWAWAANGCASVVGASLAIVAAMSAGFAAVAVGALAVYAAGVAAMVGTAGARRTC